MIRKVGRSKSYRGTTKGTKGSCHITGIYGSNTAGEAMPPIYCFYNSAASDDNYQVKPSWVSVLPVVRGKYGCPITAYHHSSVSVRVDVRMIR